MTPESNCRLRLGLQSLVLLFTLVGVSQAAALDGWWVWNRPEGEQGGADNAPRYLRATFDLPSKPNKAELLATADNAYVAFVNGHRVGGDEQWQSVDRYDVAAHLVAGKNVIALEARNAGGVAAAFARLESTLPDGKKFFAGTDAKTRFSLLLFDGWQKPDFDDSKWAKVAVLGNAKMGPWNIGGARSGGSANSDPAQTTILDSAIKDRLSAAEQQRHLVVPEGFAIELVAAEPQVINPVTMALDEQGRIYVSESHTYRYGPDGSPIKPFRNPIVRLEPRADGQLERVVVADGFDDPAMGIAIRSGKMWVTANNFLYLFDLPESGPATNRRLLVEDKNKAWNPFGMFVLEWGPDGWLYLSVGDHEIRLEGPTNKLASRGHSGVIARMKPDGSQLEQLTHGLRVPYSFEFDPFGQLWVLSNGEGNPNRFLRVLDGVDYHCFTRGVDYKWLAGERPLSPPCFELPGGAHTQLLRYYGAAYPASYQGSLFLDNWGRHGFGGQNRAVFRYVPDEHNDIASKEAFVSCADPHFRVSHIALDPDGNMLLADWYGRDDESDLTGRIWRVRYTGKDKPAVAEKLDSPDWNNDSYAIAALGSPAEPIRHKAADTLVVRGTPVVKPLAEYVATSKNALGAAEGIWALVRIGTADSQAAIAAGAKNPDWRVRKLAMSELRRFKLAAEAEVAEQLSADPVPAVRIDAARSLPTAAATIAVLLDVLERGSADDAHLRYEAAWHLGRLGDAGTFDRLLASDIESLRLSGMIALDVACYENFATKPIALEVLRKRLQSAPAGAIESLLALAKFHSDSTFVPVFLEIAARTDVPVAVTAQVLLVLKSKSAAPPEVIAATGKRVLTAVAAGQVAIESQSDWLLLFDLLSLEGPSDTGLQQVARSLHHPDLQLRARAHELARGYGVKAAPLASRLWDIALNPGVKFEDKPDMLVTLAKIEATPSAANWEKLLADPNPLVRREAVRWWRTFAARPEMVAVLLRNAPQLIEADASLKDDLAVVLRQLKVPAGETAGLSLPEPGTDKTQLGDETLAALEKTSPDDKHLAAVAGRAVFERVGCTKCHTTIDANAPKAPSLKGIGQAQKPPYLVESVLFPSKILKTGFETESIQTVDGRVLVGLVKEEGDVLRVLSADTETRLTKADVEARSVQKISIMPDGQEQLLGRREFQDLIEYLSSLR